MEWKKTKCDTLLLSDCNKEIPDVQKQKAKAEEERKRIESLQRPPAGQKWVISFGLYGGNHKYTSGMIRNAELAKEIFPGWTVWVYLDKTVPQSVKDKLTSEGCELKEIGEEEKRTSHLGGNIAGMFWRFLAIDDADVDRYIVRDADSRLNYRERFAVDEWVQQRDKRKAMVHTIRDHPSHDRPLNGGMWGAVQGFLKETRCKTCTMRGLVERWQKKGKYGADLDFLNKVVWPKVKEITFAHDSVTCEKYPGEVVVERNALD
jgi:hypothetical protein